MLVKYIEVSNVPSYNQEVGSYERDIYSGPFGKQIKVGRHPRNCYRIRLTYSMQDLEIQANKHIYLFKIKNHEDC